MKDFLFEDVNDGGYFFVEADTIEEAWSIIDDFAHDCNYTGQIYTPPKPKFSVMTHTKAFAP